MFTRITRKKANTFWYNSLPIAKNIVVFLTFDFEVGGHRHTECSCNSNNKSLPCWLPKTSGSIFCRFHNSSKTCAILIVTWKTDAKNFENMADILIARRPSSTFKCLLKMLVTFWSREFMFVYLWKWRLWTFIIWLQLLNFGQINAVLACCFVNIHKYVERMVISVVWFFWHC